MQCIKGGLQRKCLFQFSRALHRIQRELGKRGLISLQGKHLSAATVLRPYNLLSVVALFTGWKNNLQWAELNR